MQIHLHASLMQIGSFSVCWKLSFVLCLVGAVMSEQLWQAPGQLEGRPHQSQEHAEEGGGICMMLASSNLPSYVMPVVYGGCIYMVMILFVSFIWMQQMWSMDVRMRNCMIVDTATV